MAAPLPNALRQRIVDAQLRGEGTATELTTRFSVGEATVKRLVWRFRRTGSVEPSPMGGARRDKIIGEEGLEYIKFLIDDDSTWTRGELVAEYEETYGVRVSVATMGRARMRIGYTRKRGS